MRGRGLALAGILLLAGAGATAAPTGLPAGPRQAAKDFRLLQAWIAGSFSNQAQAARDPSFQDVRLHVVDLWPGRAGGRWYYVEQAEAGHAETPVRQEVHRLALREDGRIECAAFALPGPSRFVGAWREPVARRLAGLSADSLIRREGCDVHLRRQKDRFVGGTLGTDCASNLPGARSLMAEVEVRFDRVLVLERGLDAAGRPIPPAPRGAYEFVRVKEPARSK